MCLSTHPGCSRTHCVNEAVLRFTEICLPLTLKSCNGRPVPSRPAKISILFFDTVSAVSQASFQLPVRAGDDLEHLFVPPSPPKDAPCSWC